MLKNILVAILICFGGWALADVFVDTENWQQLDLRSTIPAVALIASAFALWLNFSSREFTQSQMQHENARKLRDRFYHDQMRFFLISICAIQRENEGRTSRVQVFVDDNGTAVRWRCTGTTAIGMATAGVRINHWQGNPEQKFNLENSIMNTLGVLEEAESLLQKGLITKELIKSALGNDFPFVYRVVAKITENYSREGVMNLANVEVARLNKFFTELFGPVADLNSTVETLHISEDAEDFPDAILVNEHRNEE